MHCYIAVKKYKQLQITSEGMNVNITHNIIRNHF